mmetsp:Transcript_9413/g.28643  ORF Transcript_9413/g.28643 Transcript_9413/m.28643 type:complete len:86 (-) Transcript_9413:1435-1692(-)
MFHRPVERAPCCKDRRSRPKETQDEKTWVTKMASVFPSNWISARAEHSSTIRMFLLGYAFGIIPLESSVKLNMGELRSDGWSQAF